MSHPKIEALFLSWFLQWIIWYFSCFFYLRTIANWADD